GDDEDAPAHLPLQFLVLIAGQDEGARRHEDEQQAEPDREPRPGAAEHAGHRREQHPAQAEERRFEVELRHQCTAWGPRATPESASWASIWAMSRSSPA